MRYKCIKEMCLPKCDGDGFEIPNEYGIVTAGSAWERDDRASIIGGDVHLESSDGNDEFCWIEITVDDLKENFVVENMERLTSYKNECKREMICNHEECFMDEEHCPHVNEDICPCLQEVLEKLAEYEDLEEQGKLLKLPVAVGDTVYRVRHETFVERCSILGFAESRTVCYMVYIDPDEEDVIELSDFGKTVFLTKEEAEDALKEMSE